ncbi:MAG: glycine cleavage T C-terminal barrel domain-containing protein, partial [Caldimonas sp.]
AYAWGGETLLHDDRPVGEIASAGWSADAGRCLGLAYLRGLDLQPAASCALTMDLWGALVPVTACERWPAATAAAATTTVTPAAHAATTTGIGASQ